MGKTTIEWTATQNPDGTWSPGFSFNPWWGCVKVSPGCQNCYAETLSRRWGHDVWGPAKTTPRRPMSKGYWQQPLKWDYAAAVLGQRRRVFCASMADVFEDHPMVEDWRNDLFELIELTPHLDWLLLTKRPENMLTMPPTHWRHGWPANVWAGTSCEDQRRADERILYLRCVPAAVRFLSCEPLLGAISFRPRAETPADMLRLMETGEASQPAMLEGIHWLIAGGESGCGARPCWPEWAYSLRDQCQAAGAAFFWKQWGEYEPYEEDAQPPFWSDQHGNLHDRHWLDVLNPETGEVNKGWHEDSIHSPYAFRRVGKHAAGRLLDGAEWSEFPETTVTT
jgi:protein gp37